MSLAITYDSTYVHNASNHSYAHVCTCVLSCVFKRILSIGVLKSLHIWILTSAFHRVVFPLCYIHILHVYAFLRLTIYAPTTASREKLLQAAVLLERGLESAPSNYSFSLLLLRIYALLGCLDLALRLYQQMDVKNIQHLSMSHILLDDASVLSMLPSSRAVQRMVVRYHSDCQKEVTMCYCLRMVI